MDVIIRGQSEVRMAKGEGGGDKRERERVSVVRASQGGQGQRRVSALTPRLIVFPTTRADTENLNSA